MPTFLMTVYYEDAHDRKGNKQFQLDTVDFATALTRAGTFSTALAAIMEADILRYVVGQEVLYTDSVVAGANKDEGATFSLDLGNGKRAALKIPTPLHAIRNADGTIDMTDASVTSLASEFTSGEVLISDGETVLGFVSGKLDK